MILSHRTMLLMLVGALFLLLSTDYLIGFLTFGLFNSLILGIILFDFYFTPAPKVLRVKRRCAHKFSLGEKNVVTILLKNVSGTALFGLIADSFPMNMEGPTSPLTFLAPPGKLIQLTYPVVPLQRGLYNFNDINIRYKSRLGFFIRQLKVNASKEVYVYPNIMAIGKYELLLRRSHLLEVGLIASRLKGLGTNFESLREYNKDDSYKKIDWKATARKQKLIVKDYETERSQSILIVLDSGRMMGSKVGNLSRLDHAVNAALALGYVVSGKDDLVGLIGFSGDVEVFLPPKKGRNQFYKFIDALYDLRLRNSESDYEKVCRFIASRVKRRSLILFFSDAVHTDVADQLLRGWKFLRNKHIIVGINLKDPSFAKLTEKTPETFEEVCQLAAATQIAYDRWLCLTSMEKVGAITLDVVPEKLSLSLINTYFQVKAKNRL